MTFTRTNVHTLAPLDQIVYCYNRSRKEKTKYVWGGTLKQQIDNIAQSVLKTLRI